MRKETDVRINEAACSFEPVEFRAPLKFGGRIIDKTFLMNVTVEVETRGGRYTAGMGSMPVGNVWAWPSDTVSADDSEKAMMAFAEKVVELGNQYPEFGHPLELSYHLSGE